MYWFHGQIVAASELSLEISDPAWLYGATVFTTLRVYAGSLDDPRTAWQAHCDRISRSLTTLQWPFPSWQQVRTGAEALAKTYPVLRITVFPDGRELITGRPLPADLDQRQRGITAWIADPSLHQRPLPQHKTGNYLGCWLALQAAQRQGAQEAILINEHHHWLETSTGTLWGWAEDGWWTPPLEAGILPGVMRSHLLAHLSQQGCPAREVPWTPDRVQQFEALAYSNAIMEVVPIHTVLAAQTRLEYNPQHGGLGVLSGF